MKMPPTLSIGATRAESQRQRLEGTMVTAVYRLVAGYGRRRCIATCANCSHQEARHQGLREKTLLWRAVRQQHHCLCPHNKLIMSTELQNRAMEIQKQGKGRETYGRGETVKAAMRHRRSRNLQGYLDGLRVGSGNNCCPCCLSLRVCQVQIPIFLQKEGGTDVHQ